MKKAGRKTQTLALEITAGDSFPYKLVYEGGANLTGFSFVLEFGALTLSSTGANPRVSITTTAPGVVPNTVTCLLTPTETAALKDGESWSHTQTSPLNDVWTILAGPLDIQR